MGEALWAALRFTAVVVVVNLGVLLLVLLPGINVTAFFVANAYLLGREYFEAVAIRFLPREAVAELRNRYAAQLFVAGLLIALVLAIPVVNLLTPLFATAFMVHVFKALGRA
jgi:CysZ protein